MLERRGMGGHESPVFEKDEWLTPPYIIQELAPFDLDPCAPIVRPWPTATRHYTIENDGLKRPWFGRVWLNPPYGNPRIVGPWLRKMVQHNHGTVLIFARTETELFFECGWNVATAMLFLRGRINFYHATGERANNNSGAPSVLIAYGEEDADKLETSNIDGHFVRL